MLEGYRVIELATYIAAPSAGGIMADWGADVVKVEPLAGDPIRNFFGTLGVESDANAVFDLDNRGKRSITIDTSSKEGNALVKRLIKDADVFLTNIRPGGLERAGLDYESLKEINPSLIYTSVSGYGLEGEERDRPGFDMAAFWARSGVGSLMTPKDQEPMALRTALGDHVTGMATVGGILAALLERSKTGKGRLVETSLLRTGIYSLGSDMAIQLAFGRVASTKARHYVNQPLNNFFKTSDDNWLCVLPRQSEDDWHAIARATELEHLVGDERFTGGKARKNNTVALVNYLDEAFGKRTLENWAERLDAEDLVWAPVQTPAQVTEDPQAIAAGAFTQMPTHDGKTVKVPASPVRFHDFDTSPKGPSPHIGQHNDEVLKEAGLSAEEIEVLRASKAVG
jgi:crotonobetainyl-CoA:carnitine CoA-transferase CaiB-like acyl-CoA transferase